MSLDVEQELRVAVRHFWRTRKRQLAKQGIRSGERDRGSRAAVTGGAQLDGFVSLIRKLLIDAGLPGAAVFTRRKVTTLPGFFRPHKEWDLLVVIEAKLLASIEFKSQDGSFGNNFNSRAEEAIGNATDFLTAYREGAFAPSSRPWLGYFMLLEQAPASTNPVRVNEPHFPVFDEFRAASYAKRYEILCTKLVRERLYDAACLILSNEKMSRKGDFVEPSEEIGFQNFWASLAAHATAFHNMKK